MIRFYIDEGVLGPITRGVPNRGVDARTVQDEARERTPDPEVLDRATELGRVLFSQDDDLLAEAVGRQREGRSFAGVVFAHQRRVSVGRCVEYLEFIAFSGEPEEFADRVFYIPS
jgi:hypothetical protein